MTRLAHNNSDKTSKKSTEKSNKVIALWIGLGTFAGSTALMLPLTLLGIIPPIPFIQASFLALSALTTLSIAVPAALLSSFLYVWLAPKENNSLVTPTNSNASEKQNKKQTSQADQEGKNINRAVLDTTRSVGNEHNEQREHSTFNSKDNPTTNSSNSLIPNTGNADEQVYDKTKHEKRTTDPVGDAIKKIDGTLRLMGFEVKHVNKSDFAKRYETSTAEMSMQTFSRFSESNRIYNNIISNLSKIENCRERFERALQQTITNLETVNEWRTDFNNALNDCQRTLEKEREKHSDSGKAKVSLTEELSQKIRQLRLFLQENKILSKFSLMLLPKYREGFRKTGLVSLSKDLGITEISANKVTSVEQLNASQKEKLKINIDQNKHTDSTFQSYKNFFAKFRTKALGNGADNYRKLYKEDLRCAKNTKEQLAVLEENLEKLEIDLRSELGMNPRGQV